MQLNAAGHCCAAAMAERPTENGTLSLCRAVGNIVFCKGKQPTGGCQHFSMFEFKAHDCYFSFTTRACISAPNNMRNTSVMHVRNPNIEHYDAHPSLNSMKSLFFNSQLQAIILAAKIRQQFRRLLACLLHMLKQYVDIA